MSDLKCFLAQNAMKAEDQEYIASKRFVQDGKPVPWRLRVVTNEELDKIQKAARHKEFNAKTRQYTVTTDQEQVVYEMAVASVVYPDLEDMDLQMSYGAGTPVELLKKMLTPGELSDLLGAVNEVSGFQMDMNEKIKTAKN